MNYAYIAAFTGNIISFIAATCFSWTSPIIPKLESKDKTPFSSPLSSDEASWISSVLLLGAMCGPLIYGYLADKIGRKRTLLVCAVPFLVSYVLLAFAKAPWIYYVARFMAGMSVAGVFTVIPMYVGEIAEDANRGTLGSSMNCFLCAGIMFSYTVGPYVSIPVFNVALATFPAAFLVLFSLFAPETPHYYVMKQESAKAKEVLYRIRSCGKEAIENELKEMQSKIKEDGHGTFFDIFRSPGLTKAFFICVGLIAFQQFSGINPVLFYAETIFESAGTGLDPKICSIIIGFTQFATSFLTPLVVHKLGRKILLLISAVGMVVSEVPIGVYGYLKDHDKDVSSVSFLPIVCLVLYVLAYNTAFASLPWTILGELFPANVKFKASTATATVCCFLSFLITKFFQPVSDAIGVGPSFWIFASCCAVSIPFCMFYVIETKGKSLKEIQDLLNT